MQRLIFVSMIGRLSAVIAVSAQDYQNATDAPVADDPPPVGTQAAPPSPTATTAPAPKPALTGDKNCSDFPSQAAAQAALRSDPSDSWGLDRDRDGIACESNRAPTDLVRVPR